MKACIKAGAHCTDVTGELEVFKLSQSMDKDAKAAGVVLCPGVGFDVIPWGILLTVEFFMEYEGEGGCFTLSQLMGSGLAERLPGATEFKLAS